MLVSNSEQPSGDSGAPSLDDRISSAMFGTPKSAQPPQQSPQQEPEAEPEIEASAETEATEAPEQAPETFEFEIEGEKFVLPKKLEKAVLQERDYTQKSQSLADQRRSVELKEQQFQIRELQTKFQSEVANEVRQMQMIDAVLEQPVNWQGMSKDDAVMHKIQLDELEKQRKKLDQSVQQKYAQWQQQQSKAQEELRQKTIESVRTRIPSWNDTVANEVTSHFRERGLTDADFALFNQNPAYIEAAWKAMQFDKLQAKAKPSVEQAKQVKTTSARPMPQQVKEHLAYRKALAKTAEGSPERKRVVESKVASIFSR